MVAERVAELNTEGWVNFTRLLVGHFIALGDKKEAHIKMMAALSSKTHQAYGFVYDQRAAGWCVPQKPLMK